MILVIVESPAKCKKIESFLGKQYKCLASYGHIREFANGLKSVDFNNHYRVTYKISPNKQKYVKILRSAIKKATEVMLATDDDREGEAIAWHICKVFNLNINTTKRIIFHEITKKALLKAVTNPTRINMNKVYAQQTRQILDLIVGFTTSPILWKHISWNSKKGLSAGRCQTPALNLVYDNDKLCKEAKGEEVYETKGFFTSKAIEYTLKKSFVIKENVNSFLEKSKEFKHIMSIIEKKRLKKSPPKPFTTSTLQQKASNVYNFSPKNTMKIAQTVYTKIVLCKLTLKQVLKKHKMGHIVLINSLPCEYYQKAHIPNSFNLPYNKISKFSQKDLFSWFKDVIHVNYPLLSRLVKEKKINIYELPIVVYCAHDKCDAGYKAAIELMKKGFVNLSKFPGGMKEYLK